MKIPTVSAAAMITWPIGRKTERTFFFPHVIISAVGTSCCLFSFFHNRVGMPRKPQWNGFLSCHFAPVVKKSYSSPMGEVVRSEI